MTNTTKYGIVAGAVVAAAIVASKSKGGLSGTSMKEFQRERELSEQGKFRKTTYDELKDKDRFKNYVLLVRSWSGDNDEFPDTQWLYNGKFYPWDYNDKPTNVKFFLKRKGANCVYGKYGLKRRVFRRHVYGMIDEDGTIMKD